MEENNLDQIGVSVWCTVYNHEKYLRQCLDGIVMQKTTFPFEVIIHDDASTDGSAAIIREYEERYPDIIRPIYQTVNQYSQKIPFFALYGLPMMRGKYLAVCEGDDFWCDPEKLQLQYEAMEANPDCHFCVHRTHRVSEDGKEVGPDIPNYHIPEGKLERDTFIHYILSSYTVHTTSFFRRTEDVREFVANTPEFYKVSDVGDEPTTLYYGYLGNTFYIDRPMSCYRLFSEGSWTSRGQANTDMRIHHFNSMQNMYAHFNIYTQYHYNFLTAAAIMKHEVAKCELLHGSRARAQYLLKKENRWFLRTFNKKAIISVWLEAYAPCLTSFYQRLIG